MLQCEAFHILFDRIIFLINLRYSNPEFYVPNGSSIRVVAAKTEKHGDPGCMSQIERQSARM